MALLFLILNTILWRLYWPITYHSDGILSLYFKDVKASIYFYLLAFITVFTTMLDHHDQKKPRVVACDLIWSHIKMKPLYQFLIPDQHIRHLHPAFNGSRNWWNWEVQSMTTVTGCAFTIISLLWNALATL